MARAISMADTLSAITPEDGTTHTSALSTCALAFFLVFIFTDKLALSLEIGALEVIAKLLLYYIHERVWNLVNWDRFRVAYGKPII